MVWQEHTARMSALVAQVGILDQTFGETIRPVIPTEHWWNDQHSALISELKAYQERVQPRPSWLLFLGSDGNGTGFNPYFK